jgi:hypothetical protein
VDYDSSQSGSSHSSQSFGDDELNYRKFILPLAVLSLEHAHTAMVIPADGSQPEVELPKNKIILKWKQANE